MAVGLESRAPFLDHELVEFAWRVPMDAKFRHGQGKWLLRQVLHDYVPAALAERPKMGFYLFFLSVIDISIVLYIIMVFSVQPCNVISLHRNFGN